MTRNGPEYEVRVIAFSRFTAEEAKNDRSAPFGEFNKRLEVLLSAGWEMDQAVEFHDKGDWACCVVRRIRGEKS